MEELIDIEKLNKEVLVSSDTFGQFWNICVWDYTTGTNLHTFKNCSTIPHGLVFLKQNYMLCAIHNKPYITYFNLKGKSQPNKINTSGFVSCLTTSGCGQYIVYAIEEKVFVLQAHTGKIISIITRHLQNVTCVKFASNDNYLITAADDTLILVWDFNEIVTKEKEYLKPVYTWNNHSMKINDLYVSSTSHRVVSASSDQTCKLWDLRSEDSKSTETLLFQSAPNRCVFDNSESNLYVGLINGNILCIPIKSILNDSNKLISDTDNRSFIGHKQKINCLSVSGDDQTLASGSEDNSVRIWDIHSKQCLKIINHNGPVTNLYFKLRTLFFNDEPNLAPGLFSRYTNEASNNDSFCVNLIAPKSKKDFSRADFIENSLINEDCNEEYFELKYKFENMKKINEKIYNFAIEKILKSSDQ